MLNWAARYFPIRRELAQLDSTDSILEVGSGSIGIGRFLSRPFVGCDVHFPFPPKLPMLPVTANAAALPFAKGAFEAVIVSDVLEHIPPDQRNAVIQEALRVAGKMVIFGFPCGPEAFDCDRTLARFYDDKGVVRPGWLQEHMQFPFPNSDLFQNLPNTWTVKSYGNENLSLHYWIMRKEMQRLWNRGFLILLAVFPRLIERGLQRGDRSPYYRRIFVVQRNPAI